MSKNNGFNEKQMEQIKLGRDHGVDVTIYEDPKFDARQMLQIRLGLENGVDASIYADPIFDADKMGLIKFDLERGYDISYYKNPEFTYEQMAEISIGVSYGLDVSRYADPKFTTFQMKQMLTGLKLQKWYGQDPSDFFNFRFNEKQLFEIRAGIICGFPFYNFVSHYVNPEFSWQKMREVRNYWELKLYGRTFNPNPNPEKELKDPNHHDDSSYNRYISLKDRETLRNPLEEELTDEDNKCKHSRKMTQQKISNKHRSHQKKEKEEVTI